MQLRAALCLLALSAIAFATGFQEPSRPAPPVIQNAPPADSAKKPRSSKKHGPHSVELNWKPSPTKGVEGYYVYRADGGISASFNRITPHPIKKTKYKDTKVKAGAHYAYAVSSVQKFKGRLLESEKTTPVLVEIPSP